jgi:hypothetical protein
MTNGASRDRNRADVKQRADLRQRRRSPVLDIIFISFRHDVIRLALLRVCNRRQHFAWRVGKDDAKIATWERRGTANRAAPSNSRSARNGGRVSCVSQMCIWVNMEGIARCRTT